MEPRPPEIMGEEPDVRMIPPVPVSVEGPIRTIEQGVTSWSGRYYAVTGTQAIQIADAQPRRVRLVLEVSGQLVHIGSTSEEARTLTGFRVGANGAKQMPMFHKGELWAFAPSGTSDVSVYQEFVD